MRESRDEPGRHRLRAAYLEFTGVIIDYYAQLDRAVLGREAPHFMLPHANHLSGDVLEDVLRLFEDKGFRFVSLTEALTDPAYREPDTVVTPAIPMWGYRWARQRGIEVDARWEPEPPDWIRTYGK